MNTHTTKPLYTQAEYDTAKVKDKLLLECLVCTNPFLKLKSDINKVIKGKDKTVACAYCSKSCTYKGQITRQKVTCKQCNKEFEKLPNQIKKNPNHFCGHSCRATYCNTHKTTGYRRSKLEIWLETQLSLLYPDLKFLFNNIDTINAELDIYIPELKLAFELNGIFHYEPIYGQETLGKIRGNDHRKFLACHERGISLCVIDTSRQKRFTELSSKTFLGIITKIIDQIDRRDSNSHTLSHSQVL